ncbi:MAG: pilin [bacterium]|nr:pilin [bacterium]
MKSKNQKILKTLKASFLIVICLQMAASFVLAGWPSSASAAADATTLKFEPQIRIPGSSLDAASVDVAVYDPVTGKMNSDLLARYIQAFYDYGMAAAGILAAIVLMAGGVLWLTSGGDSGKVGQAKELIIGSVVGVIILFSSWIILNTVNPELLNFKAIETIALNKMTINDTICCDSVAGGAVSKLITKDNQRVFTSDSNKLFTSCADADPKFSANTKECPGSDYSCEYSWDGLMTGSYKCVENTNICCACSVGPFAAPIYTSCKDNVKTKKDCINFCSTWMIGYRVFFYPGEYICGSRQSYNWCSSP